MRRAKEKTFEHRWFTGKLQHSPSILTLLRGAQRRVVNENGDILSDTKEPGAVLWANVGDQVILFGPEVDEVAGALVDAIEGGGWRLVIRIDHGQIAPTTEAVRVLRGLKAKPIRRRKEAA